VDRGYWLYSRFWADISISLWLSCWRFTALHEFYRLSGLSQFCMLWMFFRMCCGATAICCLGVVVNCRTWYCCLDGIVNALEQHDLAALYNRHVWSIKQCLVISHLLEILLPSTTLHFKSSSSFSNFLCFSFGPKYLTREQCLQCPVSLQNKEPGTETPLDDDACATQHAEISIPS
jgi:hypothetical protein